MVNGLIFICLIPLVLIFYPVKNEVEERSICIHPSDEEQEKRSPSFWKLMKNPLLWLFSFSTLFSGGAHITSALFIPKLGSEHLGVSAQMSSLLLAVVGVTNIFGRLMVGWIGDKKIVSSLLIFSIGCLSCLACCLVYPLLQSYWLTAVVTGKVYITTGIL